ncbi:unnamed protein product [Ceratitis capitata]|uniref:(Mediterranean fruit fly) hypothetical protein n=1 Tax=Ceratitis capitata TaxID=7213 RepID=A0A811UEF2_CERCA|nr:unnamed protein product [Ceratitis capitata]
MSRDRKYSRYDTKEREELLLNPPAKVQIVQRSGGEGKQRYEAIPAADDSGLDDRNATITSWLLDKPLELQERPTVGEDYLKQLMGGIYLPIVCICNE